jgi:adenylate cyclase
MKKAEKPKSFLPAPIVRLLKPTPFKIGFAVMLLCMVGLWRHFVYSSTAGLSAEFDAIGMMERALFDARFRLRGQKKVSGTVGVLAIDEKSIQKFGRWPFHRTVYENVLKNLRKRGVEWVGFDVAFSESERSYLDESVEDIEGAINSSMTKKGFDLEKFGNKMNEVLQVSKGDKGLATGILSFKNVIQGYFFFENENQLPELDEDFPQRLQILKKSEIEMVQAEQGKTIASYPELFVYGAKLNTLEISGEESQHGFFNNSSDPDGMFRMVSLVKTIVPKSREGKDLGEPFMIPSLSLSLASRYLGMTPVIRFGGGGIEHFELLDNEGKKESVQIPVTLDGTGRMLINHYGRAGTFPHVSLADAFDDKLGTKLPKILILGGTATGINDLRPSPFSEVFNGVEHHVATVENIVTQRFVRRPFSSIIIEMGILAFVGIFFSLVLTKASAVGSALILLSFCVVYFIVDRIFIFGKGYWIYMGLPYAESFGIYFGVTLFKYFTEEREKRKVKDAFQHYLNPSVVNELMAHPDRLKLGGEKKELTVFFSDVRGFTTISETLSPEALSNLLNEYFTPMTDIVLNSGGLLDKYIGDAMMAVWGAPVALADHADKGLQSSLLMLDALDVLREKWKEKGLPLIDIGIGLNTGFMTVGNMGSTQRFDYTVLGDSVNLGSRLESITKQYGVRIICSEFTRAKLVHPELFILRELDLIVVKGKTEPVRIFEVCRFNERYRAQVQALVDAFHAALVPYRAGDWPKAEELFMEVLKMNPQDGPALMFLERCTYLATHTPETEWNGVWVMKSK